VALPADERVEPDVRADTQRVVAVVREQAAAVTELHSLVLVFLGVVLDRAFLRDKRVADVLREYVSMVLTEGVIVDHSHHDPRRRISVGAGAVACPTPRNPVTLRVR
jgi:hypothetical protein